MCVAMNSVIIVSGRDLPPIHHQAITWAYVDISPEYNFTGHAVNINLNVIELMILKLPTTAHWIIFSMKEEDF